MKTSSELLFHKSVLTEQMLHYLVTKPGGVYVDATFGSGGHTRAILEKDPTCTVVGVDWDSRSLDQYAPSIVAEFGDRFVPIWGNFALLYKLLKKARIQSVDGILADFGTSQMQIMERPGFSVYRDMPLDMRMSPAHQKVTAQEVVNNASAISLMQIFTELGEERFSKKIANAIVHDRVRTPFTTTRQLAQLIERIIPRAKRSKIHPATRVFQALRMYINKELENIRSFLKGSAGLLAHNGRLVCISFHSLEDRLVKQFFKDQELAGVFEIVTKKAVMASEQEVEQNPSARSAKLRAATRI